MTQQFMLNKRKPKTNPLNKYILPDTVNKAGNKKKKSSCLKESESNDKESYDTIINRDKHYSETSNYVES